MDGLNEVKPISSLTLVPDAIWMVFIKKIR